MSDIADRIVGAEIMDQDDRDYITIPIAAWKGKARIQSLNAKELTDIVQFGGTNIGYKLIAVCQVDGAGRQVFRLADEPPLSVMDPATADGTEATARLDAAIERIKQRNPKAIEELAKALLKLNDISLSTKDAEAKATEGKNDSGETPTDGSPTVSPSV